MRFKIREYKKSDFNAVAKLFGEFHHFIASIDNLKRCIISEGYGKAYTSNLLKKIRRNNGFFFVAENVEITGLVAGMVEKRTKEDDMECIPAKSGRILELFVSDKYRNRGAGKKLMEKAEEYLRKNNCTVVRLDVFAPNKRAHDFYFKQNYTDRLINMIKIIKR